MSKQWQIRRGTTADNDAFTGAQGEVTMDTDKNQIRLHDGVKQGGYAFGDSVIEFQLPTAENGYTWYRKYRSGWVEQGGMVSAGTGDSTVTLLVEMSDIHYRPFVSRLSGATTTQAINYWARIPTSTTSFQVYISSGTDIAWEVKGMAA